MAGKPHVLAQIVSSQSEAAIKALELARTIAHGGESGRAREGVLRRFIQGLLPTSYAAGTGIVVDAPGGVSRQIDVIVYRTTYAPLLDIGGVQHHMVESVVAVFEIKAAIDSVADLDEALENIRSVKSLDRGNRGENYVISGNDQDGPVLLDEYRHQIFGGIVTQDSLTPAVFATALRAFLSNHERREWPNTYVDVDDWLTLYGHPRTDPSKKLRGWTTDPYATPADTPSSDRLAEADTFMLRQSPGPSLAQLAMYLTDYLRVAPLIDFSPEAYFGIRGDVGQIYEIAGTTIPAAPLSASTTPPSTP